MVDGKLFKSGTADELANDPQVRKVYLGQNFELRRAKISTQDGYL
jgi:lipopolysaccharide export system ATP-binding protein